MLNEEIFSSSRFSSKQMIEEKPEIFIPVFKDFISKNNFNFDIEDIIPYIKKTKQVKLSNREITTFLSKYVDIDYDLSIKDVYNLNSKNSIYYIFKSISFAIICCCLEANERNDFETFASTIRLNEEPSTLIIFSLLMGLYTTNQVINRTIQDKEYTLKEYEHISDENPLIDLINKIDFDELERITLEGHQDVLIDLLVNELILYTNKDNSNKNKVINNEVFWTILSSQKEINGSLTEKCSIIQQSLNDEKKHNEQYLKLSSEIQKLGAIIKKEQNEFLKNVEKINYNATIKSYENTIEQLLSKIESIKTQSITKDQEIKNVKKQLEDIQNNPINILDEYIKKNGITNELIYTLEKYQPKDEVSIDSEENKVEEIVEEIKQPKYYLGYVVFKEDCFVLKLSNNSEIKLRLIERQYVAEYQFILVDIDGNIKYIYNYMNNLHDIYTENSYFGYITFINNMPYVRINGCEPAIPLKKYYINTTFKEEQIVKVTSDGSLMSLYKIVRFNADNFLDCITRKNHTAYFILNVFKDNKYYVRNILTGEESVESIYTEEEIKEYYIVTVSDSNLVLLLKNNKFYTLSRLYKSGSIVTVSKKNDNILGTKLSGETVIIKNIPFEVELTEGELVLIDEFNNFLNIHHERDFLDKEIAKPIVKIEKKEQRNIEQTTNNSEFVYNVLIIGKIALKTSYENAFRKCNINVEVIDGYEPEYKVLSSCKGKDLIIVPTTHVSHDNMKKVRLEFNNSVFPQYHASNRLCELAIEELEKRTDNIS